MIILLLLPLILSLSSVDAHAANSVITVVNGAGSETHFDPKNWKVVRRNSRAKKCKPVVKWKTRTVTSQSKTLTKVVFKRNKISILGGYGPIGLITKRQGTDRKVYQVDKEYGPVLGLRYTHNFNPIWSLSAEYITNQTGVGAVGWSW